MAEDFTMRLPTETLSHIIDWVDEREALFATAHVCRRWRHVAFDQPRRFCWYDCEGQFIPRTWVTGAQCDPSCLPLAFAQIRCPMDHPRLIHLALDALDVTTAHAFLKYLRVIISRTTDLRIGWNRDELTEAVYDALASPAPRLRYLAITRTASSARHSGSGTSRTPRSLLAGTSPSLRDVSLIGVPLPEQPLALFSAVTSVSVDTATIWDDTLHFLDKLAQHFPAITHLLYSAMPDVRTRPPPTVEGRHLIGRLTMLGMNEWMLSDMLDEYPELSETSNIVAWAGIGCGSLSADSQPPLAMRMLERMLAHFAHGDFAINASHFGGAVKLIISRCGTMAQNRRREMSVPRSLLSDELGGILDRARAGGHELRLTHAILSSGIFAALWPVLPPDCLRYVRTFANPALPEVPPTLQPRDLPLLCEFVITNDPSLRKPVEPITLQAKDLNKFVLAALRVTGNPTAKLRLVGVSLKRATPAIKRIFADVSREYQMPYSEARLSI